MIETKPKLNPDETGESLANGDAAEGLWSQPVPGVPFILEQVYSLEVLLDPSWQLDAQIPSVASRLLSEVLL